jgi:hypothetical protein
VALLVPGAGSAAQVAPTTRRDVVHAIDQALEGVVVSSVAPLAPDVRRVAPGSRLVILSDLLGDEDDLRAVAATHFARGGEVIVLHVLSRAELELDPALALVEDPERKGTVLPVDAASVRGYAESFGAWLESTRRDWVALGATYLRLVAEDDAVAAVRAVISGVQDARAG